MVKKRKTIPKNFGELIEAGDINALKAVFEKCEINATIGYNKESVLSAFQIPDELVRWLVSQGADINFADHIYKRTPLHIHSMRRRGKIDIFLELGADVHAKDTYGNTPLHMAASSSYNAKMVEALLEHGANPLAKNEEGQTPLALGLAYCNNADIEDMSKVADVLIKTGTPVTRSMLKSVERIGKDFEFHRDNFNEEFLDATDAALKHLYEVFKVNPIEKRVMHDGVSLIVPSQGTLMEQHNELWKLLIPSQGAAKTVQGEVIRITGKVHDEIYRNGGCNWDADFKKMLDTLIVYLKSGTPLDFELMEEATTLIKKIRRSGDGDEELDRLCELAVEWVILNPNPIRLNKPDYYR